MKKEAYIFIVLLIFIIVVQLLDKEFEYQWIQLAILIVSILLAIYFKLIKKSKD